MRIEPGRNTIESHLQAEANSASQKSVAAKSAADPSLTSVALNSQEELLSQLADPAAIRDAVVNELRLKIQTGEYLEQRSAVETADAIFNL